MAYADSELTEGTPGTPLAVKLLIAGEWGGQDHAGPRGHRDQVTAHRGANKRPRFHPEAVRVALDLDPEVPILNCDARELTLLP